MVNSCESAPHRIATNVKYRDKFWIKSQPHALQYMMDNDSLAEQFAGGTIYQAFLSALSCHRWQAPISGRVVKTKLMQGTYYSEALSQGRDPEGPNSSQGSVTVARCI